MSQGNFSEDPNVASNGIFDPNTTAGPQSDGTFERTQFTNPDGSMATSIPTNRLDPTAMFFMNSFPQPNHIDTLGGLSLGVQRYL